MGLSEQDKKKHPFYQLQRLGSALRTKEFTEAQATFESALVDIVFQYITASLKALEKEPDVNNVVEGTHQVTDALKTVLTQRLPWMTTTMLERFDLVKKKK